MHSNRVPEVTADHAVRCPVCRCECVDEFFHVDRLPLHVGMLYDTAELARSAAMGSIALVYCDNCSFVFNRSFEPERLIFTPGYEVQLVHSPVFTNFLVGLATRLVDRYQLRGKNVADIGCGAGHFLRLLCERGGNRGLGIDPTVAKPGPVKLQAGEMRLVRDSFGAGESADWQCDFASCQSVLEDIHDPLPFVVAIRRMLAARQGIAYLEVFNATRAFSAGETWSLTYEQCNYFSPASLNELARRAGFRILESGCCYGEDQYLYAEVTPYGGQVLSAPNDATASERPKRPPMIAEYAQLHAAKVATWRRRIDEFRSRGTKVAVWGSGGKGICFLNTVGAADVFSLVVDINPDRQRRHIPGGQLIVGPADLQVQRPAVIAITNPIYEQEIRATVHALGLQCEFMLI